MIYIPPTLISRIAKSRPGGKDPDGKDLSKKQIALLVIIFLLCNCEVFMYHRKVYFIGDNWLILTAVISSFDVVMFLALFCYLFYKLWKFLE